jgi:TPR repeat protein
MAAQSQNVDAMFRLGNLLEKEAKLSSSAEMHGEAARWFGKAAELEHSSALNALGSCYFLGNGVQQDFSKAVSYFRKSSDQVIILVTMFAD